MPLRHRHEYVAGIPRDLPTGDINREGVPDTSRAERVGARRYPAIRQASSWWSAL